eukprot:COSAG02_NODE_1868_length_10593_cov_8.279648_7_plen_160_part_00
MPCLFACSAVQGSPLALLLPAARLLLLRLLRLLLLLLRARLLLLLLLLPLLGGGILALPLAGGGCILPLPLPLPLLPAGWLLAAVQAVCAAVVLAVTSLIKALDQSILACAIRTRDNRNHTIFQYRLRSNSLKTRRLRRRPSPPAGVCFAQFLLESGSR